MGIVFARAWEDDRLDLELLAVRPGARVLVVAGAGDLALALAADGADVTAVDTNPDQLRLVALKSAAGRALEPPALHRWFEAGRDPGAPAAYDAVRAWLAPADAAYWDREIGVVARGLRDVGVARPFLRVARVARILAPGIGHAVETVPDLAAQLTWWHRRAKPWLFGPLTHLIARRTRVFGALAPNPVELERMRMSGWSYGLVARVEAVLGRVLVRRHPWWRPAFSGRPADPGDGAAWLDAGRTRALADGRARLALVEADVAAALRAVPPGSLEAISLSNVPDWIDPADAGGIAVLAAAVRAALAPGGRVLVRRVVRPDGDDPFAAVGLARDPGSDGLAARDRTALYEVVSLYRAPR